MAAATTFSSYKDFLNVYTDKTDFDWIPNPKRNQRLGPMSRERMLSILNDEYQIDSRYLNDVTDVQLRYLISLLDRKSPKFIEFAQFDPSGKMVRRDSAEAAGLTLDFITEQIKIFRRERELARRMDKIQRQGLATPLLWKEATTSIRAPLSPSAYRAPSPPRRPNLTPSVRPTSPVGTTAYSAMSRAASPPRQVFPITNTATYSAMSRAASPTRTGAGRRQRILDEIDALKDRIRYLEAQL